MKIHFLMAVLMTGMYRLPAQDVPAVSETNERRAWLLCTGMPEGFDGYVRLSLGAEVSDLILSSRSASMPVKIPSDGIFQIIKLKKPVPEGGGKSEYEVQAQVHIPNCFKKTLVILSPAENDPTGMVLDAKFVNLDEFKAGSWLFINSSQRKVGVDLGDAKVEIHPNQWAFSNAAVQAEPIKIAIRYLEDPSDKMEWKLLTASTVVIYPTRREICVFSWDRRNKRMEFNGIVFSDL